MPSENLTKTYSNTNEFVGLASFRGTIENELNWSPLHFPVSCHITVLT